MYIYIYMQNNKKLKIDSRKNCMIDHAKLILTSFKKATLKTIHSYENRMIETLILSG